MDVRRRLLAAVLSAALVFGVPGATVASFSPGNMTEAAGRMQSLNLVRGDEFGNLRLNDTITRAELVTIIVRAFGKESEAADLQGAPTFIDTAGHWAGVYIAMADKIIQERSRGQQAVGLPDGSFNPDGNVTAAEAVAFLMKFVGARPNPSLPWPASYIQGAVEEGMISTEDAAMLYGLENQAATRGLVFYLADTTFYNYRLAEGGTVYTSFTDSERPKLTLDPTETVTFENSITVSGMVSADTVQVMVGPDDTAVSVSGMRFSVAVPLNLGNNTIPIKAFDLAGNVTETAITVTRTYGALALIRAEDFAVGAGETRDIDVAVVDSQGNSMPDAWVTGESDIGTYVDGRFTAGSKAGTGRLTLRSGDVSRGVNVTVTAGPLARIEADRTTTALGQPVRVSAIDRYGNVIAGVKLTVSDPGASVDSVTGSFVAQLPGPYEIRATQGDITVSLTINTTGPVAGPVPVPVEEQPGSQTPPTESPREEASAGYILKADDGQFLGDFSPSTTASTSICNPGGTYGSSTAEHSIWNSHGSYGSADSPLSPFNPRSNTPPVIYRDGKVFGYLTVNEDIPGFTFSPVGICQQLKSFGL